VRGTSLRIKKTFLVFAFLTSSGVLIAANEPAMVPPAPFTMAGSTESVVSSPFTWRSVPNTVVKLGENFQYVVSWGVIKGGYSTLTIPETTVINGRPAFHIVSEATSVGIVNTFFHVKDRNEAWLDEKSLLTVRWEKHIHEGKFRVEETGILDQVNHQFSMHSFRVDKNRYEDKQGPISSNILDVLGSLYYVRTLPLEVGQSYTLDVYSGEKVWPLVVDVKKRERVKVPAGTFDCFVVQPQLRQQGIFISKGKKLLVWITADERRLPVRMRSEVAIGHVSADLVSLAKDAVPQ
jgi:hypothetical protein